MSPTWAWEQGTHRFCCWKRLLSFTHVDKSHSTCWIGKTPRLWEERGWPSSQSCWITSLDCGLLGVIEKCFYYSSLEAQITKTVGIGLDINYIPEMVRMFDLGMSPRPYSDEFLGPAQVFVQIPDQPRIPTWVAVAYILLLYYDFSLAFSQYMNCIWWFVMQNSFQIPSRMTSYTIEVGKHS